MRGPALSSWFVVVTLTAVGAAAAAGYGLTAPKRYRATAQILVSPVPASDPTFVGLDVLRGGSGKRTAAETAAVIVRSPQVADAVRAQIGVRRPSASLLHDVSAHPVGDSDVVDVTVEGSSAASSAQLANAFVDALVAQRTASLQSELSSVIRRDARLLASGSAGPQSVELARRLAVLRSLQGQPDPTLRHATTAVAPSSSSWPNVPSLVALGAGVGLAAAVVLVLLVMLLRYRPGGLLLPGRGRRTAPPRSERAAEALVDRLEQRLAGRESALTAREHDLQAKIEELRALDPESLAERERQVEARIEAVTKRELEVVRRVAASKDARERDSRSVEREQQRLEAREAALADRERRLVEQELAEPPAAAERPAAPVGRGAAAVGAFNLSELEQLVEARGPRFPDRLEEWRSYLFFLRDYAEPDGSLPASFDWLVQDTFRELLQ